MNLDPKFPRRFSAKFRPSIALAAAALALAGAVAAAETPAPDALETVVVPATDLGADTLAARRSRQVQSAAHLAVRHDFQFSDRRAESGIDFRNHAVLNAAKRHMMVHYDHGNGIAVADVDGDERLDVYFVNQVGGNQLWRNLGEGRFENVTEGAGVAVADRISVSASFADVDNDGDADLYVTTVRQGNLLFLNDGRGVFTDATEGSGVGYVGHSSAATFLDFDLDGDLDLLLANVGQYTIDTVLPDGSFQGIDDAFGGHLDRTRHERSLLFRGDGTGHFEDATDATGLIDFGWTGDATFTDVNGDRFPDLYLLNMQGDDHFYQNQGGTRFEEVTSDFFPKTPWGTMGIKFFDYNNDGRQDLYLTDMHSDMVEVVEPEREKLKAVMTWTDEHLQGGDDNLFGNGFYERQADGSFEEISDLVGAENFWPWGLSVGDLNADGFEDAFVTSSMNYPFRYGINSLLLNDAGRRFVDAEFLLGVEPRADQRIRREWFRADCGGDDDEHPACQESSGPISVLGNLGTRSSALFDLDGDGDLDIVTNEFHSEPQVLISDLAQKHEVHFVEIELVGSASNRDGLGASVTVIAGDETWTRYADGKSGYLSQSRMPLYFGLGGHDGIDSIRVDWPSGRSQILTQDLAIDRRIQVVEPTGSG